MSITLLLAFILIPNVIYSAQKKTKDAEKTVDIYDLSLDDNLYTPAIENEDIAHVIADFQLNVARELKKGKYNVELMRKGEVVVATIPASQLFNPNDTVLSELGSIVLKPFVNYLKTPDLYKMILVMHSDNTGSETYTQNLCNVRVEAVFDWFAETANTDYVVPYALGSVEPLLPNNSVDNRKQNRRLEIYLVPSNVMIKQARSKKIKL